MWKRARFRVLLADPVGFALVDGITMGDDTVGLHIGLTHWVDVTHLPSGMKMATFRTLGGAFGFAERLLRLPPPDTWALPDWRPNVVEAETLRNWIAQGRETEDTPRRESI